MTLAFSFPLQRPASFFFFKYLSIASTDLHFLKVNPLFQSWIPQGRHCRTPSDACPVLHSEADRRATQKITQLPWPGWVLPFLIILTVCGSSRFRSTTKQEPTLSQMLKPHFALAANSDSFSPWVLREITNELFTSLIPVLMDCLSISYWLVLIKHYFYWTVSDDIVCGHSWGVSCGVHGCVLMHRSVWSHLHWCWLEIPLRQETCIRGVFGGPEAPHLLSLPFLPAVLPKIIYCAWEDSCLSIPELEKLPPGSLPFKVTAYW